MTTILPCLFSIINNTFAAYALLSIASLIFTIFPRLFIYFNAALSLRVIVNDLADLKETSLAFESEGLRGYPLAMHL